MEYMNDMTYGRGDDVRLEITVEAERAKTGEGAVYKNTYVCFYGTSQGYRILDNLGQNRVHS